jgi:NitT/TauT family transport system substrate-binding protein
VITKLLLLIVALAGIVAVACGNEDTPAPPTARPETTSSTTTQQTTGAQPSAPAPTQPTAQGQDGNNGGGLPTVEAGERTDPRTLLIELGQLSMAVPPMGVSGAVVEMADRGGFFEEIGIRVNLVRVPNEETALAALQSGQVQLALLSMPTVATAATSASPVRAVAGVMKGHPYNVMVSAKVAEAKGLFEASRLEERLAMLEGLRIAVAQDPLAQATARLVIEESKLQASRVGLVTVPREQLLLKLQSGEVDGVLAPHPLAEQAIAEQDARVLLNLSRGELRLLSPFPWLVVATNRRMEQLAPNTLTAVAYAVWNAERQIQRDPNRSRDLLQERYASLPAKVYEESTRLYFPALPTNPLVTPLAYSKIFHALNLDAPPFLDVVDNKYIERLIPRQN